MIDIRKIVIVLLIAILFSVFVFSTIDAVYPSPEWDDFCAANERAKPQVVAPGEGCAVVPVGPEEAEACGAVRGYIDYRYDSTGCATESFCNTCQREYDDERDRHNQWVFYISAVLALVAIFVGLYLPATRNSLNEWIGTGFLLGGAFVLIFGTIQGYGSLHRYIKPVVMLVELLLVIFLAYKKVKNLK